MDSSSITVSSVLMIFLAFFLVFLNGFFVLSEFAIVKIRRSRLEELVKTGRSNAKLALTMSHKLDSYLSATQLGITLSSLALGWIGEPAVASLLGSLFAPYFNTDSVLFHTICFVIAFTLITVMHVVLGELVPKSIAIARSEASVLVIARPLHMFWILFYPLIKIFDKLAAFFLRRLGIEPASEHESAHSEEEIKFIVGESLKGGYIDTVEENIIKNAVNFSDTLAREIMTPRRDIIFLKDDNTYEENLALITATNHTRYPYCKGNIDMVVGMIHIRDILCNALSETPVKDFTPLVRDVIIVPETASISAILAKMTAKQIHTAIILDEYGGTAGMLTLEDIIEEVMGDITDEHDEKNHDCTKIDDLTYEFDGMITIEDAFEYLSVEMDEDIDQVTLGGYVFNLLERVAVTGDRVRDDYCEYEVLEVDGARIKKIRAVKLLPDTESME